MHRPLDLTNFVHRPSWRHGIALALAPLMLVLITALPAKAEYPEKPIKVVIPYPPGAPDAYGRLLTEFLGRALKQPLIVENKPGAGGGVGAQTVARSPADGYTLLFAGGSLFLVNPTLYKKPIYSRDQFAAVSVIAEVPFVFIARKDLPVNTLAELTAMMQREPGKIRFGNPSLGSQFHMLWEQYKAQHQLKDNPVMVGPNLLTTLLNGDVDVTVLTPGPVMQYFETGQMNALAVTGGKRLEKLPNVQTVTEAGLPILENVADYFLMAPKGIPRPVIDRIAQEVNVLSSNPEYIEKLGALFGAPGRTKTPDDFEKLLDDKSKEWSEIVIKSGASIH
jgi:tripartite-type tricarboxylate transporter receptor subunit TctC